MPIEAASLARLYRTALADGRRLLVLDNAASAEQVRPLLPGTPACMTLVTSRSRLTGLVATGEAHRIGLAPLPEQDAVNLLRTIISAEQVHAQPGSVTELAALCGHLPLALRSAAANSAAHPDRLLSTMLDELGTRRLAGLQVDGDHELAVRRAFDLTCNSLPAPALRLFILLARSPLTNFTVEAAGALADVRNETAARLIDKLAIARVIEEQTSGRYRIHDLLRPARLCGSQTTKPLTGGWSTNSLTWCPRCATPLGTIRHRRPGGSRWNYAGSCGCAGTAAAGWPPPRPRAASPGNWGTSRHKQPALTASGTPTGATRKARRGYLPVRASPADRPRHRRPPDRMRRAGRPGPQPPPAR